MTISDRVIVRIVADCKIRRSEHFFVWFDDSPFLDVDKLFEGKIVWAPLQRVVASSAVSGTEHIVSLTDLAFLSGLSPGEWQLAADAISRSALPVSLNDIDRLARAGLVVADVSEGVYGCYRLREDKLKATRWNRYSALYHALSKWRDVHRPVPFGPGVSREDSAQVEVEREARPGVILSHLGKPPHHFHAVEQAVGTFDLPLTRHSGGLYDALVRRETCRNYDTSSSMTLSQLSTVLYYVWGAHGYFRICDGVTGLKKTSPSGGDLHPIEAYPLISGVDGVEPGLYHYNVENHRLDRLCSSSAEESRRLADRLLVGQSYFANAHVTFLVTARFARSYWKYRYQARAYGVILMDVGHLSQSLYLVCADNSLGAYITAAINGANIEDVLGVDGIFEGAIAACGCGVPGAAGNLGMSRDALQPSFRPYCPRVTVIENG